MRDMSLQENVLISDLLKHFWCYFGVKQQELDDQLSNLVILFEAFKHLHNLKVWLRFAPQRLQSSHQVWESKKILTSYCTDSVVAMQSWELQIP